MEHEDYLAHRSVLIEISSDQWRSFDKAILTVASGALAFSLAFSNEFVTQFSQSRPEFLHWSWVCFAASVLATTSSYFASGLAAHRELHLLDRDFRDSARHKSRQWLLPGAIHVLNFLSLSFTAAGVVLTVAFALSGAMDARS